MSSGAPDEALELLIESYHGEVFGEAVFGGLAGTVEDPAHKETLTVLATLETEMQAMLLPLVPEGAADKAQQRAIGKEMVEALVALPWSEFVASIEPVTNEFLAKYRRLREVAPNQIWASAAETLVEHELALRDFARGEVSGDPDALQPVSQFLGRWALRSATGA